MKRSHSSSSTHLQSGLSCSPPVKKSHVMVANQEDNAHEVFLEHISRSAHVQNILGESITLTDVSNKPQPHTINFRGGGIFNVQQASTTANINEMNPIVSEPTLHDNSKNRNWEDKVFSVPCESYGSKDNERRSMEEEEIRDFRLNDSMFFLGKATDASSYTLQSVNKILKLSAVAVFITWISLVSLVYIFTPQEYFRPSTTTEKRVLSVAISVLLISIVTKCLPLFLKGWANASSGVMVGALTVQVIAILTDLLMLYHPIPVRKDPVTNLNVYMYRWCEFTSLSFMMLMLTEASGTNDVHSGSKLWPVMKIPVIMALSQAVSTFCALLFPLCPGRIIWYITMTFSCLLYLLMFPRLYFKRKAFLSSPKGSNVHSRELHDRCRLSYRLMALCTFVFSTLVFFYFAAWAGAALGKGTIYANESIGFLFDTLFEALSKVVYLSVIIEVHTKIFDESQRAFRLLEELRQMMAVVWDCSSDIVVISVKGWNGNVTTMLSPKCLRYDGIDNSSLRAIFFDQTIVNIPDSDSGYGIDARKFANCVCMEYEKGKRIFFRAADDYLTLLPSLNSFAELIIKAWTESIDEVLISHDLVARGNEIIQCEANVTKLDSSSMVIVVRDISDRFKRFEAEKQAVLELTARTKDAEANRFTRHEVKNGLLAAMALCENVRESIRSGGKSTSRNSFSTYSAETLANIASRRRERGDGSKKLSGSEKAISELENELQDILDSVLSEAMARDVIHECYAPKMERFDIRALLRSHCLDTEDRYQIVTYPSQLPVCISDPQLIKCIHRNAMRNAVTYGKQGGPVLTEIFYKPSERQLMLKVTNLPGKDYGKILEMGEKAQTDVFAQGRRLHTGAQNDDLAFHSSGDGAWIAQKCAKTLGGRCNIFFETDRTVFTFECPIATHEDSASINSVDLATFKLPANTFGIAIDDSGIQRKLLAKIFNLLDIQRDKQLVMGANAKEISQFNEVVIKLIQSNPDEYFLLIADENLDVTEDLVHHQTVSGSALIHRLRNDLGPELERRLLAVVRSANDSSTDTALYLSRSHGFFPKAPIKKDKVFEILAPLWIRRFPDYAVQHEKTPTLSTSNPTETFVSSAVDLMNTLNAIDTLCKQEDISLHLRWQTINENLHVLKGDILCWQPSYLVSYALQAIDALRSPTPPRDLSSKWFSIKTLVEAMLRG